VAEVSKYIVVCKYFPWYNNYAVNKEENIMIILEEILISAKQSETDKDVKFSTGFIRVSELENQKEWEASLEDIEEYGPLLDLFSSNKPSEFEFTCSNGKVFRGKIAVTSILASDILFRGVGPLKDEKDNIVA